MSDGDRISSEHDGSTDVPVEIVEASIVSPAPHPLRFGIRSLLLLTGACAVVFAFMSYLGTLVGVLAATAGSAVALGVLIFVPIVLRIRPQSPVMARLDQLAIWLTIAILLLVVGAIFAGGGQIVYDQINNARRLSDVKKELGFTYEMEYVTGDTGDANTFAIEAMRVVSITSGGVMDTAGVKKDDVIISELTEDEFLDMLLQNRGDTITITVDRGSGTIKEANQQQLELALPN